MGDSNEHKKFYEILSFILFFVALFLLNYYKKYVLSSILIYLFIFFVKPQINKK